MSSFESGENQYNAESGHWLVEFQQTEDVHSNIWLHPQISVVWVTIQVMKIRTGHSVVITRKVSAGVHSHHENKVRGERV